MLANVLGRLKTSLDLLPEHDDLSMTDTLLADAVQNWREALHAADATIETRSFVRHYDGQALEQSLDHLAQADSETARLEATLMLADCLVAFLQDAQYGLSFTDAKPAEDWDKEAQSLLLSAGSVRQAAARMVHAERLSAVSEKAAKRASASAAEAEQAAGTAGESSLASWFDDYGKREHLASSFFRLLAFVGLASAACLAWWFFLESETQVFSASSLVFRAAILLAVAAFSTYAIRLASQHRQQGSWAKSIAVQLKSFQAFIRPVADGATKDAIYLQFAKRILGESPLTTGDKHESSLNITAQDLISLVPRQS